jgi:AcrR family transcriptional regulator
VPKTDILLTNRSAPVQERGAQTMERVLRAAAELLQETGFENLSTNAICERAGLTPPALYRYFPNKYAVMRELGERLMDRQNEALAQWAASGLPDDDVAGSIAQVLKTTLDVTRDATAGGWIMRSLHASPLLSEVRLNSHRKMTGQLAAWASQKWPDADAHRVFAAMRLSIEIGYAVVEMIVDDETLDADALIAQTAEMIAASLARVSGPASG